MSQSVQNKIFKLFFQIFLFFIFVSPTLALNRPVSKIAENSDDISEQRFVEGEILVKFKTNRINLKSTYSLTSQVRKMIFNWNKDFDTKDVLKEGNILHLKIKNSQNIDKIIAKLRQDPNVEFAEPNYIRQPMAISTNDTYRANLWGLDNTGQTVANSVGVTHAGTIDADMDIPEAWAISTGSTQVIVAVIDSGVAYNHPDLINTMWDGTNCVDENGSALGGCLHGYDYGTSGNDNNPLPSDSDHGTHVAGTIAASYNNSTGIVGSGGAMLKIMAIKMDLTTASIVKAADFATQNGAKIINASYGGGSFSQAEYDSINRFRTAGGIFVAAAGNAGANNDVTPSYPDGYNLDNIISVAATDQDDLLASFSNYGATKVDVGAPGVNIYSTTADTEINYFNFDDLVGGTWPATWNSDLGSSWGTYNIGGTGPANMRFYGDLAYPYTEGVNSVMTSDIIDMSGYNNGYFDFYAGCDTEVTDPALGGDYMTLETSSDSVNFNELVRWNEYELSQLGQTPGQLYHFTALSVGASDFTTTFKYRLRWVTDNDGNTGGGDGCAVEYFTLYSFSDGSNELYDYKQGTSMASPNVAGVVGLLWSAKPSATRAEIISAVLDQGDTLASLTGYTSTGRRVNAYKSMLSLNIASTGPSVTGLTNDSTPAQSKTWTWSSDNPGTDTYRFSIDQSVGGTPAGAYSVGTTTTYSTGTGTFYIHVQAQDASSNAGNVSTASFILDNTGPSATLVGGTTANTFSLTFGETLYSDVGATFASGADLKSRFTASSDIGISAATYNNGSLSFVITSTPVAGSMISLLSGASNKFYDSLTNIGGVLTSMFDGSTWLLNPTTLTVGITEIPNLISSGQLVLSGGTAPYATSIAALNNLTFNIGTSNPNSIGLTASTTISELNDASFDSSTITGSAVDVSTISNLETGYTPRSAIQWGIPGITLKFSQPITILMYLGSAYDGQTLNIYRSASLSVGWTSSGLSSTTCLVASGYCGFSATQASYYTAAESITPTATPTTGSSSPTPTPTSTSSPASSVGGSINEGPQCRDRTPSGIPDLFKIITTKGTAKLVFTPINNEPVTGYAVIYGLKKGDERFASMISTINNNQGEQSFTVKKLNPKSTYYYKVAAFNGCTSGAWSDWIPAKSDRNRTIHKYKIKWINKIKTLVNQYK